jgi:hypothetical protein
VGVAVLAALLQRVTLAAAADAAVAAAAAVSVGGFTWTTNLRF